MTPKEHVTALDYDGNLQEWGVGDRLKAMIVGAYEQGEVVVVTRFETSPESLYVRRISEEGVQKGPYYCRRFLKLGVLSMYPFRVTAYLTGTAPDGDNPHGQPGEVLMDADICWAPTAEVARTRIQYQLAGSGEYGSVNADNIGDVAIKISRIEGSSASGKY